MLSAYLITFALVIGSFVAARANKVLMYSYDHGYVSINASILLANSFNLRCAWVIFKMLSAFGISFSAVSYCVTISSNLCMNAVSSACRTTFGCLAWSMLGACCFLVSALGNIALAK